MFVHFEKTTKRKNDAIASLHRQKEQLLKLIDNQDDMIVQFGQNGKLIFVNTSFCKSIGKHKSDIVNTSFINYIHQEDRSPILHMMQSIHANSFIQYHEARFITHLGLKWYSWSYQKFNNESEDVATIIATGRNITQQKQLEEQAKKERDFAQTIIETARVIILVLDTDGRIISFNPYFEKVSGFTLQEVQGQDWFKSFIPTQAEQKVKAVFSKAISEIHTNGNISQIQTKHGALRDIEWFDKSLKDSKGAVIGLVCIGHDITDTISLEKRLRQTEKIEFIGKLSNSLMHEFNNILTGVIGYADLIKDESTSLPNILPYVNELLKNATNISCMIQQFSAISHKRKSHYEFLNVQNTLEEILALLKQTSAKHIQVHMHPCTEVLTIKGDFTLIQNAILNIVLNAKDAMPKGGTLSITTCKTTVDMLFCENSLFDIIPGDYVAISFKDSGKGMNQQQIEQLFESSCVTKKSEKTQGLGLSIIYSTIKEHKGALSVTSEINKGTEFIMYLPYVEQVEQETTKQEPLISAPKNVRIFCIDDEKLIGKILTDMLESVGYEVIYCQSAHEALNYFRNYWETIDCIILDLLLPDMNGATLLQALRSIDPLCKVIIASGLALENIVKLQKQHEVQGFIHKPFRKSELSTLVSSVITGAMDTPHESVTLDVV